MGMLGMPIFFADFCAGWGYLAAEVAARAKNLKGLELFEADYEALEALNLDQLQTCLRELIDCGRTRIPRCGTSCG